MRTLVIPLLVVLISPVHGAFERLPYAGRGVALGFASASLPGCPWGVWHNPAALNVRAAQSVSVSYIPGVFGITELSHASAVYTQPFTFGTMGVGASRFGFNLYRETRLAVSASTSVNDFVHAGITLNYYNVSIQNYGAAAAPGLDAGLMIEISDELWWGSFVGNVTGTAIGGSREKIPQLFSTGITFSPVREALLTAGLSKDIRHPVQVGAGFEYSFLDMFAARIGTSTEPAMLTAGVGITVAFGRFDYGFSSHSLLGSTHTISLTVLFNEVGDRK